MSLVTIKNESAATVYGAAEGQYGNAVAVDSQGRLLTAGGGAFGVPSASYMNTTQTSPTVETYDYYQGGDPVTRTGGTLVATMVVTYFDASKALIQGIGRTL